MHWQHGGQQKQGQQPPRAWQCTHCGTANRSKHQCSACGLKRSYASVAKSLVNTNLTQDPKPGNPVRAQLAQVATALTRAVPEQPEPVIPVPAAASPPVDAKDAKTSIQSLETAMNALPEGPAFASSRAGLQADIDSLKASIRDAKPVGARLDDARAALARARARRTEAIQALELAQAALAASDEEITRFTANVEELEKCIAPAGETDEPMIDTDPQAVLASISSQLGTLMESLKADTNVNPLHTEAANSHVQHLLQGFQQTIDLAAAARVPRRLQGKQPPAQGGPSDAGTAPVLVRHTTKKPIARQSTLFGHGFVPVKKHGYTKGKN